MDNAPTKGNIKLRDYEPKMYVVFSSQETVSNEDLVEYFETKYPDAIFVYGREDISTAPIFRPGDIEIAVDADIWQENPSPVGDMHQSRKYNEDTAHVGTGSYWIIGTRYLTYDDSDSVWSYTLFDIKVELTYTATGNHKERVAYALPVNPSHWSIAIGCNYTLTEKVYSYDDNFKGLVDPYANVQRTEGVLENIDILQAGPNASAEAGRNREVLINTLEGVSVDDGNFKPMSYYIDMMLQEGDNRK